MDKMAKYILIGAISVIFIAGGFFAWQYWWLPREKAIILNKSCRELTLSQCQKNPKCGILTDIGVPGVGVARRCIATEKEENGEVGAPEEKLTFTGPWKERIKVFLDSNKNIFKVPLNFCIVDDCVQEGPYCTGIYQFTSCQGEKYQKYYELDLNQHNLLIDNIISIAVDPDFNKIAYVIDFRESSENRMRGFIYDIITKKSEEINAREIINIIGAVSSWVDYFSPKGRFLYFTTGGETEYILQTIYDTEKKSIFVPAPYGTLDKLESIGYTGGYVPFGKSEEYMIFLMNQQGDCLIENTIPAPGCHFDTIMIQNIDTGETKIITTSNRKYGYFLKEIKNKNNLVVEKYWFETAGGSGYKSAEETIKNIPNYLP